MKSLMAILIKMQFLIIILVMLSGCAIKYTVKGKVVDAETGEPIEGAVYAVYWYTNTCKDYYESACLGCCLTPFGGSPFGLSGCSGEADDGFTAADGTFKMVKYADTTSGMAVYKKGYVCWTPDVVYYPELFDKYNVGEISYDKVRASRQEKFKIGHGMVIKLRLWRKEYSESALIDHADFCKAAHRSLRHSSNLFGDAIWPEILLLKKHKR